MNDGSADFYNDGSTDQVTVLENVTAFAKYRIRPRVLRDVSKADTSVTVLGRKISFPLSVSPAGIQAIAHPDGELATSRACARRGIHMGVSSFANYSVEEITSAGLAVGPIGHVMQLYTMKDRALQERIIKRAEAAGAATHDDSFVAFNSNAHSWAYDIPWLRSRTKMQIWIKGVLTAEDVMLAREYGCDGVVVSNHGGRQLDGVPATLDALPECVAAAGGKIPIHIDGGFRTGADIFKAIALGAECCWIGRPVLWGLAYDGEKGVETVLNILHEDFRRCMMLAGCKNVSEVSPASLALAGQGRPLTRL
ncbi:hypothetical protein NPX13_g4708 [Xylaria arbuscula]|uniref:FMN hydroxy acid dehydrogenase domain-containing protein n=1 Tax=Xylaria arbuscula TaxID=114810 RepID=A0A9W8NFZ3_9PEZI|nr:hypothetical protein NPX13_g4708 [Xylaria arbuscula]